ncbi:MAG: hypothetical protein ACPGQL_09970 [Thermoplasmatota archaeon]
MSATNRTAWDFLRKLSAVLLVLSSLTLGIIGLGMATGGDWRGALLILVAPLGVLVATRVTPEAGSSGYCDENL